MEKNSTRVEGNGTPKEKSVRASAKKTAERTVALRKIIYNSLSDQHKTSAGGETNILTAGKPKKERQHHGC
jgi:hypothetical protein